MKIPAIPARMEKKQFMHHHNSLTIGHNNSSSSTLGYTHIHTHVTTHTHTHKLGAHNAQIRWRSATLWQSPQQVCTTANFTFSRECTLLVTSGSGPKAQCLCEPQCAAPSRACLPRLSLPRCQRKRSWMLYRDWPLCENNTQGPGGGWELLDDVNMHLDYLPSLSGIRYESAQHCRNPKLICWRRETGLSDTVSHRNVSVDRLIQVNCLVRFQFPTFD